MKVLVTGGGGFLGKRITEKLLARGDQVRVFGRHPHPQMERLGAECAIADIRNPEAVAAACQDMDAVIHAAGLAGIWGPRRNYMSINVKGTANVIHGCLTSRITRLVLTSSPSVVIADKPIVEGDESLPYPKHFLAPYPESKAMAERMVLEANGWEMAVPDNADDPHGPAQIRHLTTCALRPHLIWGPGDPNMLPRIVTAAEMGRIRQIGDGKNLVSITYIDNAADAHLQALDALTPDSRLAGNVYFINDEKPVRLWQWIQSLLQTLNCPPVRQRISYPTARALACFHELTHSLFPSLGEPPLTRFTAAQMANTHTFSYRRAAADFGYHPGIDNETGMQRLATWFTQSIATDRSEGPSLQ